MCYYLLLISTILYYDTSSSDLMLILVAYSINKSYRISITMIRLYAKRWRVYLLWKVRAQACAAGCLLVENNWVCEIWTIIYSFRALLLTSLKNIEYWAYNFRAIFEVFFLGLKNDLSLPESILAPQTVKGGHFSSWSDHNRTTPSWPHTFFKKHTLIKKTTLPSWPYMYV